MPHHIVIVEDEPVTQARLQSYFTQEGYTVSVTASGAGLREIMQNQPVDLILLDINLPDENGLMLTRAPARTLNGGDYSGYRTQRSD